MGDKVLSELEKVQLFQSIVDDLNARRAYAASLSIPVRQSVKEQSSIRMIFAEDPLPAGALPLYPVDMPDAEVWVVPRIGGIPTRFVGGDEVLVQTFEVSGKYSFKMSYARDGRYNVTQRAKQKLSDAVVKQEEETGWTLIRASVPAGHVITVSGTEGTYLSKKLLNEMISFMEDHGYAPDLIVGSTKSVGEIRMWDNTQLDEVTRREIWQAKGLKAIWDVAILGLRRLADNEVYLFDTSRYGVLPVRQALITFEDPVATSNIKIGLIAYEEIGMGVLDAQAVVKGSITRA